MWGENAKPAALTRLWHILTRTGRKAGSQPPALLISRRSSGDGCNGARKTEGPFCRSNTVAPKTKILTRDRLKARGLIQCNRDLQAVERYVRLHETLTKGDLTCER